MKVHIDDAIEIRKPEPDSHFRLRNCRKCRSDNAAYVKYLDKGSELWRVSCFDCGYTVGGTVARHDVQVIWNGVKAAGKRAAVPARAAG